MNKQINKSMHKSMNQPINQPINQPTNQPTNQQVDVVVVGAGPVGLLTAIELALGGVHVAVLERLAGVSMVSKALGMGPLGGEALQRRGMAEALDAAEARNLVAMKRPPMTHNDTDAPAQGPKLSGHFAGLTLIRTEAQKEPGRRGRLVDQQAVEAMLAERALALGIAVRRECEVASIVEQDDGIDLQWTSPTGAGQLRCSWLVGCDGGRSAIRKMAGFEFPGTDPSLTMYTGVVQIDHPERLSPAGWRHTPGGMIAHGIFGDRIFMLDFSGPPADREAPVTREEFEAVLRRISGAQVRVTALDGANRWTDNTRLVDTYRRGRVLLAGDAAHIHSPFGGQGMGLGLGDAANLGWKLAAVIRGEMPDSLLDTYTSERRPVAEAVMANTLAQTAIMRPDPQSTAMRELMARLLQFDDVNQLIGSMMRGLSTRYDCVSAHDDVGRLIGDRSLGHSNENNNGTDGSLYALMQDGWAVLLDAGADGQASNLVRAMSGKPLRIRCVAVATGPSMLIRPDACLAWIGEGSNTDGLAQALRRWFQPS